eukprot:gene2844-4250_t
MGQIITVKPHHVNKEKEPTNNKFFNISLIESIKNSEKYNTDGFPLPLIRVITFMENPKNLTIEGIYRISGMKEIENKIIKEYENGNDVDLTKYSAIDVMGLLKTFLKKLSEPLTTKELYQLFKTTDFSIQDIQRLMKLMPSDNLKCLKRLLVHFKLVSKFENENKMSSRNLSIVFSYGLFWSSKDDEMEFLKVNGQFNSLLNMMIEEYDEIFRDDLVNLKKVEKFQNLNFSFE